MIDFKTREDGVKKLLEQYPSTRCNDHELYIRYFENVLNIPFTKENFIQQMQSFEGISRARRRIQEKCPELIDIDTAMKRAETENQYVGYYSN